MEKEFGKRDIFILEILLIVIFISFNVAAIAYAFYYAYLPHQLKSYKFIFPILAIKFSEVIGSNRYCLLFIPITMVIESFLLPFSIACFCFDYKISLPALSIIKLFILVYSIRYRPYKIKLDNIKIIIENILWLIIYIFLYLSAV